MPLPKGLRGKVGARQWRDIRASADDLYEASPAYNPLNVDFYANTGYRYEALRRALQMGMSPDELEETLRQTKEARREYFHENPDVGRELWDAARAQWSEEEWEIIQTLYWYH
jgi:hypothetical protein